MDIIFGVNILKNKWKNWKQDDFTEYPDGIFNTFRVDRILYGSDRPVCLLAAECNIQMEIVGEYIAK